ncbi:hypothetical protein F0562_022793 [Nyssa sinensis]|uniref:Uncharacterized protein n=1 Tax=Nyssa sinensis TaxID=561372 RepID=A0A5J5BKF0_9ASTE|nr:hypothetical protein F0562_022793 [Nyssa sinensis]
MGRNQCCAKDGLNRGAWSFQEDQLLINYVKIHGEGKWRTLAQRTGLKRCGKSCRLRWLNYLRPDIKRGNISADEEDLIIRLHNLLGNRWALIAGRLPGRTDNEIKNYWNTNLAKKLNDQTSKPAIGLRPLKSEEKKPIEGLKVDKTFFPPEKHQSILNTNEQLINCDIGKILSSSTSTPLQDDSLDFLMDFDISDDLILDDLSSYSYHIYSNEICENGDVVGGNNIHMYSSYPSFSEDGPSPESEMKRELSDQPTFNLELKKVASFLDLEDE